MKNSELNITVAVEGTPEAQTDLATVEAAINKTAKSVAAVGDAGELAAGGLDKVVGAGRQLATSKAWDSYKSGATGAKTSTEALAKSLGNLRTISRAGNLRTHNAEIERLSRLSGVASGAMAGIIRQMDTMRRNRAFEDLRQTAGLSVVQFARLQASTGNLSGAMGTLARGAAGAGVAVTAVSAAVGFAAKVCFDAALQTDRLSKAYASITGSSHGASVQLGYLQEMSGKLGLEFVSTAQAAKTFFAAGKGTTLAPELNRIFEAVSTAGTALALTGDDMQGVFLALEQMISKGKVQAEELRGQLGERLPGAFQHAAKAMGMTTAELDKFMADGKLTAQMLLPKLASVLQNEFGPAAVNAAQGIQGAANRLSTEWILLKASMIDSEMAVSGINAVRAAVQGTSSAFATLSEYSGALKGLAVGAGISAGVMGIAFAIKTCLPLLSVFTAALGASRVLTFAGGLKVASSALAGLTAAMAANPVTVFAVAMGGLAAWAIYLGDKLNEEKAILRTLNDAQKTAEEGAKALAEAHKLSADELDNLIAKQREAATAMQAVEASVRERLSTQSYYGFDKLDTGSEQVIASLNMLGESLPTEELGHFEQALEDAKYAALQDGDWKKLQTELDKIERHSKGAGDYTTHLRNAIEQARAASRDAITYNVRIKVTQEVEKGLLTAQFLKNMFGEDAEHMKGTSEDWRESRDAKAAQEKAQFFFKVQDEFNKTTAGKARSLKEEIEGYRVHLADPSRYGLNAEQVSQLQTVMKSAQDDLEKLGKKGGSGNNSALNSYQADIERTTASVKALQEQLDAPANDTAARDRIRIAKEYEQAEAAINKEYKGYAEKNGIGQARADELKNAKLLEAQSKQNLALRDIEAKNADIRLDFEKRYADMTGATSAGVIASIKKQAEEYEKAGADQVRVAEWTQDQIQRASREGLDGIQVALKDFQNEYSNDAKNFGQLYGDMFRGIDSGFNTMWEDMVSTGKVSLSSFKSMFRSFLADLLHMSITRPITVQIAGVMSGVFGGAGSAAAAGALGGGSGGGSGGLLGNLPISQLLPNSWTSGVSGLFGGVTGAVNGWAAGAFPSVFASNPAAAALNGFAGVGPTGMLSGALSAGALGGGLGSLGYSMLGGAIGLPQSKYSGITSGLGGALGGFAGSALASSSMMAGSAMAAGATMGSVFPVVGTIIGALAGGLLGALTGRGDKRIPSTNLNNGTSASLMGTDYASLLGREHWGTKMDGDEMSQVWGSIGAIANETVTGFQTFASALPEQYAAEVNRALSATSVRFDYDAEGRNYKIRPGDDFEADMEKAAQNIQNELFAAFGNAIGGMNLSGRMGLSMDLSSGAGIEKAVQGVTAWKEMQGVLDGLLSPVAALTTQTNAANAQMNTWIDSLRALGWQEHKLAEIEARRADYVSAVTFQLRTQFDMEMTLREATLRGTGELVAAQQAMWADMQSIITNFGAGSEQAKRWEAYQREAIPKMAEDLAKNQYQSQIDSLKQEARQQVQGYQQVVETLLALRASLRYDARVSPFATEQRTDEAGAAFGSAYAKAMTGDAEAARSLSGLSSSYLELLKAGASTSSEYETLFFGVMSQLEAVEKLFGSKIDGIDPGLLEQQRGNKTLAEILAEIAKLEQTMKDAVSGNAGSLADYLAGLLNGSIRTRATGGYTSPGLTLVGEEGPELVNFARPGMVYTAEQTQSLLRGVPASAPAHSQNPAALLQEIYLLRRDLALALDRQEQHSRRIAEAVEQWNDEGLPAERNNTPIRTA